MKKSELINLLVDIEDNGNVDEILKETDLYKSSLSLDNFKSLVAEKDEFKKYIESSNDKHFDKALKTWKANNLEKLVEAEVLKRTGQAETPEQKSIRELQEKLASMEKEKVRAERIAKFKDKLAEKKIPSQWTYFNLGDHDYTTDANITIFENSMKDYIETQVTKRLKSSSHIPARNSKTQITREEYNKLPLVEKQKLYSENPNILNELG